MKEVEEEQVYKVGDTVFDGPSQMEAVVVAVVETEEGSYVYTLHDLLRPKRVAKPIRKQTGITIDPPPASMWKHWLVTCVQRTRARGDA